MQKQALENEQQPVCQIKEEFNLQSEMAIVDAKVKVQGQFDDGGNQCA